MHKCIVLSGLFWWHDIPYNLQYTLASCRRLQWSVVLSVYLLNVWCLCRFSFCPRTAAIRHCQIGLWYIMRYMYFSFDLISTRLSVNTLWTHAGSTTKENFCFFPWYNYSCCHRQGLMSSKTLDRHNSLVLNWGCWLTKFVLFSDCKMSVIVN